MSPAAVSENLIIESVKFIPEVQAIRRVVFQQEQGVPETLEFDRDDAESQHLLARWQGQPVGTMRIRRIDHETAKIQRVAVLPHYRACGIGRAMMQWAIADLQTAGVKCIKLNAQQQVEAFYRKLGFATVSTVFEEAGIPHVAMEYRS